MQTNIIKKVSDNLNSWPIFIKIKNEINESKFVQPLLVMAVMGWIPGAWSYLIPVLAVYGVIKRKELVGFIDSISKSFNNFFNGSEEEQLEAHKNRNNRSFFSRHMGEWLGGKISSSPLNAVKVSLSFYIFIMSAMPWSLFMIYALFRPKTEILEAIYKQFQSVTSGLQGFFQNLSNVQKVFFTLVGVSISSAVIGSIFVNSGLIGIVDASMTITMLGLTVAGFRFAMTDLAQTLSHPLKLLTHRMGIFLGIIGGNRLAHNLFFAKISGSLGPTYGTIESSGFFSSLYRMFFSTDSYSKDSFYFANSLYNRIATGTGSLLGNLFFSHTASTYGTFYGTLGPSSYQLLFFMIVGGAVGYFIDKVVDKVSTKFLVDAGEAWENKPDSPSHSKFIQHIKSSLNWVNNYRYPIVSTLAVTHLMYSLKVPMYIHILHTCSSPMLTVMFIEGGLLLPALFTTKAYRMAKERFFSAKKEPEPKVIEPIVIPEPEVVIDKNQEQEKLEEVLNQKLTEGRKQKSSSSKSDKSESSMDGDEISDEEKAKKIEIIKEQQPSPEPVLFAATQPQALKQKDKSVDDAENSHSADAESSNEGPDEDEGRKVVRSRSSSRSPSRSPSHSRSSSRSPVRVEGGDSSSSSRSPSRSRSPSPTR